MTFKDSLPTLSLASKVSGNGLPRVSGSRRIRRPEAMAKAPKMTYGRENQTELRSRMKGQRIPLMRAIKEDKNIPILLWLKVNSSIRPSPGWLVAHISDTNIVLTGTTSTCTWRRNNTLCTAPWLSMPNVSKIHNNGHSQKGELSNKG